MYLYLNKLTIIRVVIQSLNPRDKYIYMSNYSSAYIQLYVFIT